MPLPAQLQHRGAAALAARPAGRPWWAGGVFCAGRPPAAAPAQAVPVLQGDAVAQLGPLGQTRTPAHGCGQLGCRTAIDPLEAGRGTGAVEVHRQHAGGRAEHQPHCLQVGAASGRGREVLQAAAALSPVAQWLAAAGVHGSLAAIDRNQQPVGIEAAQALEHTGGERHQRPRPSIAQGAAGCGHGSQHPSLTAPLPGTPRIRRQGRAAAGVAPGCGRRKPAGS